MLSPADREAVVHRFGRPVNSPAVPLLPPDASDGEWLDYRRWMLGASELAAVLPGVRSPYASPYSLFIRKRYGWTVEATREMDIGTRLEPLIGELFAEDRPDLALFRPGARLYGHPVHDWLCCTPDFLAVAADVRPCSCQRRKPSGPDGTILPCKSCGDSRTTAVPVIEPVECKSDEGGPGWGRAGTSDIPEHHRVQLVVQCAIFGSRRGHLVRFNRKRITAYQVTVTQDLIDEWTTWTAHGKAFVEQLLDESSDPPPIDDHKATEAALSALYADVDENGRVDMPAALRVRYRLAQARVAAAKAALREAQNEIRARLGTGKYAIDPDTGQPFAERRAYKVSSHTVPAYEVDAIYPKGDWL